MKGQTVSLEGASKRESSISSDIGKTTVILDKQETSRNIQMADAGFEVQINIYKKDGMLVASAKKDHVKDFLDSHVKQANFLKLGDHEYCYNEPHSGMSASKPSADCTLNANLVLSNLSICVETESAEDDIVKRIVPVSVSSEKSSGKFNTAITFTPVASNVAKVLPSDIQNKSNQNPKQIDVCDLTLKKNLTEPIFGKSTNLRSVECPKLSRGNIKLLLKFLDDPEHNIKDLAFMTLLATSSLPYDKSYVLTPQLLRWSKLLTKRKIGSTDVLCLCDSQKIILPKEEYKAVVMEAHLGSGRFDESKITKNKVQHNSYAQTIELIESNYGVGEKEFGMSKSFIYQVISTCTKCTSEDLKQELDSNVIFDPDIFNESRNFDLNEAPLTMAWGRPPPGSIWFNQKGLADQRDHYSKLLGVINELGLDLGATAQGCEISKDRLMTKLYCAERLILDEKEKLFKSREKYTNTSTFFVDYQELEETYLELGRLDLFLYDVNCLLPRSRLTRNEHFFDMVNETAQKILDKQSEAEKKELMKLLSRNVFQPTAEPMSSTPQIIQNDIGKLGNISSKSKHSTCSVGSVSKRPRTSNVVLAKKVSSARPIPSTDCTARPNVVDALRDHDYTDW